MSNKQTIEQKINEALDNIDLITDPYQKADLLLKAAEVMIRAEGISFGECTCKDEEVLKKTKKSKKHADAMKKQPETLGSEDMPKDEPTEEASGVEENAVGPVEEPVPEPSTKEPAAETPSNDPWAGHEEELDFVKNLADEYGDDAINYALSSLSQGLLTDWKADGAITPENISALIEVINALMESAAES